MSDEHVGRSRSPSSGDGRDRILEAAVPLFAQRGFDGVSISDVAEGAGLVKSAIYHHFSSKEALYRAVLDEASHQGRRMMAEGAKGETWLDRLRGAARVLGQIVGPRSHMLALILQGMTAIPPGAKSADRAAVAALRREFVSVLAQEIAAGITVGDLRPVDPELAGLGLIGLIASALQAEHSDDQAPVQFALDLFLHGASRRAEEKHSPVP